MMGANYVAIAGDNFIDSRAERIESPKVGLQDDLTDESETLPRTAVFPRHSIADDGIPCGIIVGGDKEFRGSDGTERYSHRGAGDGGVLAACSDGIRLRQRQAF